MFLRGVFALTTVSVVAVLVLGAGLAVAQDSPERTPIDRRVEELEKKNAELEGRLKAIETAKTAPAEAAAPSTASPAFAEKPPELPKNIEQRLDEMTKAVSEAVSSKLDGVELHALVDGGYYFNTNNPARLKINTPPPQTGTLLRVGSNLLRVNDPDQNTFQLTYAKLAVGRPVSGKNELDAGFQASVGFGREAETTLSLDKNFNPGAPVAPAELYADLQLPTPLNPVLLRVGRFYGFIGIESLDIPTNPNFSLSYFSNFTPFTMTGGSVGTDLIEGTLRYTQYIVNCWDLSINNNDNVSYGGQLSLTLGALNLTVNADWYLGFEKDNNNADKRRLLELDVIYKPTATTTVLASAQWGNEDHSDVKSGRLAKFGGVFVVIKQEFLEVRPDFRRFYVAARGVYYRDEGGSKSGLDQSLADVTATFGINITQHAMVRLEYRHDFATKDHFFVGRHGTQARDFQDTVSFDASYDF